MTRFPVQKLLFDLDGTLVDTARDLHASTNHALSSVGRDPVPFELLRPYVGFGALKLLELGLNHTGGIAESATPESLRDTFLSYYISHIADFSELFDGGAVLLEACKDADVQMAVCTNKPETLARKLLDALHLTQYFPVILGGDSLPYKKPDPRHLTTAVDMLRGTGPTVMVGDSSPDILAAKAANIPVIAASYGYIDVDIMALEPDATAPSLGAVLDLISF